MSQLISLIEKAATIAGSEYKLAKVLGTHQPIISQWKSGKRPCSPIDRAALASVAGVDAAQEAIEGLIEGIDVDTPKGRQAKDALDKALANWRKR